MSSRDLDDVLGADSGIEPSPRFTARTMDAVRIEAARGAARVSIWESLWPALAGAAVVAPLVVLVDAIDVAVPSDLLRTAGWLGLALVALLVALPTLAPASRR